MQNSSESQVFAIYSRKSKFTGKGESIENQIEMCRQYIVRNFGQEQADNALVYEDEGFSGGSTKRPNFQRMLRDVHKGNIQTIVCYRLDRLTRNTKDCFEFVDELEHYGATFISIKENFDLTTPTGRLMFTFIAALAQMERETIAERIRDNLQELAKTGRWLGGNTPLGYESEGTEYCKVDGKKRKTFHLKFIPEEVKLVQIIFSKFLELKSLTKLETFLLNQDYKTRQGKPFTRFAIREIIMNPVYAKADEDMYQYLILNDVRPFSEHEAFDGTHGIMAYNRTDQNKGSTTRKKPIEEWVVAIGEHEGIISGKDWVYIQKLIDENKTKSFRWRTGQKSEALLSGLLHCRCGHCMRPKATSRTGADGERLFRYLCELKEKSRLQKCQNRDINGNQLDRAICFEIKKLLENKSEFNRCLTAGKKTFADAGNQLAADLERLKKAQRETQKEINALVGSLAKMAGTPGEQSILDGINERSEKNKSIQENIQELEQILQEQNLQSQSFEVLQNMLRSFANTVDEMTVEQKRLAIRMIIKDIIWDGEKIHIYFFGDEDAENEDIDLPPIDYGQGDSDETMCEDSKCYPHTMSALESLQPARVSRWHPLFRLTTGLYMMSRHVGNSVLIAPLYIHSFRPLLAHTFFETERMMQIDPDTLTSTADKLRYCRHVRGLEQKETAAFIGIHRGTYAGYEIPSTRDYYPLDKLRLLAELFEVPLEYLLDDYNKFLYEGQGRQVRSLREEMGLSRREFANKFGVGRSDVQKWENDSMRMTRRMWERIFEIH